MDAFEAMGFSEERTDQLRDIYIDLSVTAGSAAAAFQAMVEVLRPTISNALRTCEALARARLIPRQYRISIMRKKIHRAYRVT